MTTMIYHIPYAFDPASVSASAIRPIRMYETFKDLGIEVLEISGHTAERKRRFESIKKRVAQGMKIDFMYSENATIPPMVTDPNHLPVRPLLDLSVFRYCSRHNIPSGVFYRDIYWKFEEYDKRVGRPLASLMKVLYRIELAGYARYADIVYLPSNEMGGYLPQLSNVKTSPLPPGGDSLDNRNQSRNLSVFYIGGIGGHYRLHHLFEAVSKIPDIRLTVCTGKDRWESVKGEYPHANADNIDIVHKSGDERDALYRQANLCYVAMEPEPYGGFASPVKLYEYIGRGKAMIAMENTLVGRVVTSNGIGWTTDNSVAQLTELLVKLRDNFNLIEEATRNCERIRSEHTWECRAKQVIRDLTGGNVEV